MIKCSAVSNKARKSKDSEIQKIDQDTSAKLPAALSWSQYLLSVLSFIF